MDDAGWNVTETAVRPGCERGTLSRLLNGKAGVSAVAILVLFGARNFRILDLDEVDPFGQIQNPVYSLQSAMR